MTELLVDPLTTYGFMRAGLAAAAIVGVVCSVLSCLLVVRHQALLGDAVSHAVLLGVAVGYLAAGDTGVVWGALLVAVLTSMLITYVERNSPVKRDAVMGICFTAAFALGLAIISVAQPRGIDVFHVLFGNVLGVSGGDLVLTATTGGAVLATVLVGFRTFQLWSFDSEMARAVGIRTGLLEYLFSGLLAAAIVASLQTVGLVLVIALLITPGATAQLLTSRLSTMMAAAAGIGLLVGVGGLYGSFYANVSSGPAIVLAATACFALAFAFAPREGLVPRQVRARRARRRVLDEDLLKTLSASDTAGQTVTPEVLADRVEAPFALVARRLRALVRRGLVTAGTTGPALTEDGRGEAARIVRTHRLLEQYAHEGEGVPLAEVHDVADRLEHEVTPETVADIDRLLDQPDTDPHGHPIPPDAGQVTRQRGRPLTHHEAGFAGVVTAVADDDADLLARLVDLGILPQRPVTVVTHDADGMRVRLGDRELELPEELAVRVAVEPT